MYTVKIRNSIMIAHSLKNAFFGPAQNLHGATFVVDVEFFRPNLTKENVVIDIAYAHEATSKVLKELNYKNLDDLPQFEGMLTTTEFMAKYIHDAIKENVKDVFEGKIKITLGETHNAWGSYSS